MMKDYFVLRIHRDDHHCGSCWEAGDESDEYIIADSVDEAIKRAARSIVLNPSRRVDCELRSAIGGELDGSIHLLHDPVAGEYYGKALPFEMSSIYDSQHFADAKAEKVKADAEAKARYEAEQVAAAKRREAEKEEKERKQLEELKAKYEVPQ